MGAGVALQLAIRHPEAVRRLVVASASFRTTACTPRRWRCSRRSRRSCLPGRRSRTPTCATAPNPGDFPKLVEKLAQLDSTPFAWPEEDIRGDRRAHADRPRRLRRRAPGARRRVVPAARRRRDGRPCRAADVPAGGAARDVALRPARLRPAGPRRLAAGDDPAVPRARRSRAQRERGHTAMAMAAPASTWCPPPGKGMASLPSPDARRTHRMPRHRRGPGRARREPRARHARDRAPRARAGSHRRHLALAAVGHLRAEHARVENRLPGDAPPADPDAFPSASQFVLGLERYAFASAYPCGRA